MLKLLGTHCLGSVLSRLRFCAIWYIHITIIVTWSGVLYHMEWMRSYHRITQDGKRWGWSNGIASSTRRDTVRQIKLLLWYVYYILFQALFWFYNLFWPWHSKKIVGTFAITLRFLMSRHHVFPLWFHAWKLLYVASPQKQETDISLV